MRLYFFSTMFPAGGGCYQAAGGPGGGEKEEAAAEPLQGTQILPEPRDQH